MTGSLLIVDDDASIRSSLARALSEQVGEVRTAASAEEATSLVAESAPDVVLSDVRMPGMDGVEFLRLIRERRPGVDVILMTAYDDLPTVATAMREGAVDFLTKPLDLNGLRRLVERVLEDREARAASEAEEEEADETERPRLVGKDPRMVEIFKLIGRIAESRTTVVIRGESGTGKELVARAIHRHSPYADEPFVAVNCAALPPTLLESELFGHVKGAFTGATSDRKGRFALAGRGTVFLDEIGDTSPEFQGKLLRVLEQHEYYPVGAERPERAEARVVTATHRDLERMVRAEEFREDLYYRLRVVEIEVPPLRERMEDLPALARHLVRRASRDADRSPPTISDGALDALRTHSWPGNVRELENCLKRAVLLTPGDVIRPEHLKFGAPELEEEPSPLTTLDEVEAKHVASVLEHTGGHKTRTAEILGISRPRLNRLIEKYGIRLPGEEDVPGGGRGARQGNAGAEEASGGQPD